MSGREITLDLRTNDANVCAEEKNKREAKLRATLYEDLRDYGAEDLPVVAEQVAKSFGVYLSFDRAKTGSEKDWMYMVRVSIPGGGPLSSAQWEALDSLSEKYVISRGGPSLRLTTRQNVQFHWIRKADLLKLIKELSASGLTTLNGCGDNARNVMACPLSRGSHIFDANALAVRIANYFALPAEPYIQVFEIDPAISREDLDQGRFDYGERLLNRKFKIAISAVHRDPVSDRLIADNCVEALTNDLAVVPIVEGNSVKSFQIYIGGGQGERNGKPTISTLASPLAIVEAERLLPVLDAVVAVHRDWGDRKNRHWARLKYVVKAMGIQWYRERVEEIAGKLQDPSPAVDCGARYLHHGWCAHETASSRSFGMFVENGRITDASPNGHLKTLVRELLRLPGIQATITPNQDLIFSNIASDQAAQFNDTLKEFGYGLRNGKEYSTLRLKSGSCVGKNTCRLAYTDSEQFEPELIDSLEELGWDWMATSIGVTGCERQCFRPATKAIGLVGSGLNVYQLKLGGTEDGRYQGVPLIDEDGSVYLKQIPRDFVHVIIDALFRYYETDRLADEEFGYFIRRVGFPSVIGFLKSDAEAGPLMAKTWKDSSPTSIKAEISA
jgi:sulfite reductase beta subunit-like hemoprotein